MSAGQDKCHVIKRFFQLEPRQNIPVDCRLDYRATSPSLNLSSFPRIYDKACKILIKVSLLTSSNAIFSQSAHCTDVATSQCQKIVMRMPLLLPLCAMMWWSKIHNKPWSCSRHTLPKHTAVYHFLLPREDKFSLRDFALWGLHTLLSWEHLWHNSCSLIFPRHRSMGRRVPYRLVIHWWHGICLDLFSLSYLCKLYYNGTSAEV